MTTFRLLAVSIIALGLGLAGPAHAAPPPGMPDPVQMSGIPRPDPNLPGDTVTVRCLDGGFANPAVGITVELELTAADGSVTKKQAVSAEQGRARFDGLASFAGQSAVAKATIAGQSLSSQPFTITGQSGVALLLVASGSGAGAGSGTESGSGSPHGGQGDVPLPGKPFPLEGRPRGTLIVGALDLSGTGRPIANIEVTLTITVPGETQPRIKTATTDEQGRVVFEKLDEELPASAAMVVSADLGEGGEPQIQRSESFSLGDTAYAIVLTKGSSDAGSQPPPGRPPSARIELPPPRVDPSLEPGQVRVFLIDAHDQPVPDHDVTLIASEMTGSRVSRTGKTDASGQVILEVPLGEDTLGQVRAVHDGAPWSSSSFSLPSDAGAMVFLRVFEITADRSRVRSAIQIDISPRENDFAAVSFLYAVFVEGDEAFWPRGGMRIHAPDGTRSLHVLPEAEDWIVHDGEATWVDLAGPLPPGEEVRLSFAVGIEHDGSLEVDWSTPFPLVEQASLVTVPPELKVTHGVGGPPETNPHAGRDGSPLDLYRLGHDKFTPGVCDLIAQSGHYCPIGIWEGSDFSIVVEGLPIRSRVWPISAWVLLGVTGLGVLAALALRRRVSPREALLIRRDALIAELVALDEAGVQSPELARTRARIVRTLDRIYRQLEALSPR